MREIWKKATILILFNCSFAYSADDKLIHEFAQSRQWKLLLQYKKTFSNDEYGKVESGSRFYLSSNGQRDTLAELKASIQAFTSPESFIQKYGGHPQCLFPARFILLRRHFLSDVALVRCPALIDWKKNIGADKLYIVFASQFLANPASIMGHTFFKFHNEKNVNLLNITFGYAANIPEHADALEYIYKGIFGGFDGVFSEDPFFRKVYEYNNIEDRDLWEFEIKLLKEELDFLLDILWELKQNARINYFFIDENCSYVLLSALQPIFYKLNFFEELGPYVLPLDTVKVLNKNGLINEINYRPSARSQLAFSYSQLTRKDQNKIYQAIKHNLLMDNESIVVLDVLLDYLSVQKEKNDGELESNDKNFKNKIMLIRSQMAEGNKPKKVTPESPLNSHKNRFVEYGFGKIDTGNTIHQLAFRPGIHGKMDYSPGFLPNSELTFMTVRLDFISASKKTTLSQLQFINLANAPDFLLIDYAWAWRFNLGIERLNNYSCFRCMTATSAPAIGLGFKLSDEIHFQTLFQFNYQWMENLAGKDRIWLGPLLEMSYDRKFYKILLRLDWLKDIVGFYSPLMQKVSLEARRHHLWSDIHLAIRMGYNHFDKEYKHNTEGMLSVLHDF